MCGIALIWNFDHSKILESKIINFTNSMAHRGPDNMGFSFFENNSLALGHRRLSIIDLSKNGNQPMNSFDNRYTIIYNGEVYNFLEIRNNLENLGFQFQSNSDTEVILNAYIKWGDACLDMFNGEWAIAIWDNIKKELFLARDRFGIKPLYYLRKDNYIAFASETRAFKYLEGFKRSINDENYNLSKQNNYALEGLGYTIFNDIYQILPGHKITITKNGVIYQKRWYNILDNILPTTKSFNEQTEVFYALFKDACKLRLISDVPLATALSGGLDSTSIYSTVFDILKTENNTNQNIQLAVSAIFPGLPDDEKYYVEKAIEYTNGSVKWITTNTQDLSTNIEIETELFDSIIDSPITAISGIYKGMKNSGVSVSLDGHGVDEMLYGYLYLVYDLFLDTLKNQDKIDANNLANILSNLYHPNEQLKQNLLFKQLIRNSISLKNKLKLLLGLNAKDNSYNPIKLPSLSDKPYDFSKKIFKERVLFYEFFQNTLPGLLRNFDRASMMNSVEIRMPFMDHRIVEFIFSLPFDSKLNNGFTKFILRQAMKNKMNEEIRVRKFKVGIKSPFEHWAQSEIKDWLFDKVKKFDNKEDREFYLEILNKYYNTSNSELITQVWYKINYNIINGK